MFDINRLLSFLLLVETEVHQGVRGYGTYCHVRNANDVFKKIDEWHEIMLEKEVKIKLHDKEDVYPLSELKGNLCMNYFKRYFEKAAQEGPVVLPQIPSGINKVVDTMEHWCNDSNDSSALKGLIVHSFNVSECFRKLFYDEFDREKLRKDLDIKNVPSTPIIIVYNPSKSVILLIRTSGREELRKQIEFCSHDMKMFMLLFGNEVKRSRVKVISLLANNNTANENLKCENCKNCIISFETLESDELFENWFHNHAENFNIDTDGIDETNIIAASAKLIGYLAAAPYFDDLPTFTKVPKEQMKHLLVMLTPIQKSILYSGDKHLIIQGPYGSGKSIVAHKKLQMLSDQIARSKKNEEAHFICHDSKSALLNEIGSIPNVTTHGNKGGEKLSEIIKNILKVANTENINLIIDEYDGENLDKEEAGTLNDMFEKRFQDAIVFLVRQSMEKERNVSIKEKSEKERKNRFDLIKKLKRVDLTLVMRNSIEIGNLICVTQNFLKEQETIYQHLRGEYASIASANSNKTVKELAVSARNSETKKTVKNSPIFFSEKKAIHVNDQEQSVKEMGLSEAAVGIKKSIDKPTYKAKEDNEEKISVVGKSFGDFQNQDECAIGNFGLDEAFGFAGVPRASKDDIYRIVNKFRYIPSEGIGHNINSWYPKLFEVDYDNTEEHSFEKLLALTKIFKIMDIKNSDSNNKHVILHFDTSTNKIPKLFAHAIEYLKISHRVTSNYKDFKNSSKSILICNFRLFRGLEHSNVTIIIDQDVYSVQHYLVEVMARCTNKLNVIILERSDAISKITALWKDGLNGQKLIEQCKVQKSISRNDSTRNDEEIRKIFHEHGKEDQASNIYTLIAEQIIQER